MGNTFCCSCFPWQGQNDITTNSMPDVQDMDHVDALITYIDELLRRINTGGNQRVGRPNSVVASINSGCSLIEKLSKQLKWHVCKKCFLSALDRETRKVVLGVLHQAELIPLLGMALSIIAHVLERAEQTSSNKDECLRLLRYMSVLAKHMKNLDTHLQRNQLDDILIFIVKETLMCVRQMEPHTCCRFIFAPVDAADLEDLESQLLHLYPDLELQALTQILNRQQEGLNMQQEGLNMLQEVVIMQQEGLNMQQEGLNRLPKVPNPSQGEYPHDAVGVEEAQKKVIELLDLKVESPRVVVIYGVGGIGKTTLATAVLSRLSLQGYHHCKVFMDQDANERDLPPKQKQILHDLFQENLELNHWNQGREKLSEAFGKASKPVFLFIDNTLKQSNLEKLLPIEHISRLPKQSRILVTTRNIDETKIFQLAHGVEVYSHRVESLSEPEAKRALCHYALGDENASFDPSVNVEGFVQFCGGIPLVLRIVGSHLRPDGNTASACNDILKYLMEWQRQGFEGGGGDVSERVVDFVYWRLKEHSREAFLDIAFFFQDWERIKVSEIIGEMELRDLEGAALVTTYEGEWELLGGLLMKKTKVKIHDIVRARGKWLAKGNRVTDKESWSIVVGDHQKLQQIKGVWLGDDDEGVWLDDDDEEEEELSLPAKDVDLMSKSLRVLSLGKHMRLNGRCERAFQQLRFLHISYEDMLPLDLREANRLIFFQGHLIEGPHTMPELPVSLRVLHLSGEKDCPVSLDIIGHFTSLRELKLFHITLHSFGNMSCLQTLDMSWCSQLQGLPESFGNMSCLQTLDMSSCSELQGLPESFGNMSCLQRLYMSSCSQLQGLPESFGKLKGLKFLKISNCKELNRLPEDIVCLTSLAAIKANRCASLEAKAMDSLVEIRSLKFLDIDDSPMLIKRWEEIIQQHPPPIRLPLRLTRHSVRSPYEADEGTVSAMFFSGGSTFPHVDGESMSSFPDVGVKVCLFFTACDILSHEVKEKLVEVAFQEFQIMYVDVGMEGEAQEEREKRIREVLRQLPEGSRVWTSPFYKTRLLFAYSLWRSTGGVNTSIWSTNVLVDGEGRRKLSQPFEKIFQDYRSVESTDLFSPLDEAWSWMNKRI